MNKTKKTETALYFDCKNGISGDMVYQALRRLAILENRENLSKTCSEELVDKAIENLHRMGHSHSHSHANSYPHNHPHTHPHQGGLSYRQVVSIIDHCPMDEESKRVALAIYKVIGQAESVVHGQSLDSVHFHEVGRTRAIKNIVGIGLCISILRPEAVYCSPLHEGRGYVECSHGKLEIPVPAVVEMLKEGGFTLIREDREREMITPSGLAALKGLGAIERLMASEELKGAVKVEVFGTRDEKKERPLTVWKLG